jgi:tetratricopeptide (TPR) repeat protein
MEQARAETISSIHLDMSKTLDMARIQAYKGHVNDAAKIFVKAIRIKREDKDIYYFLADILINDRRYNIAMDLLSKLPPDMDDIKKWELIGYCNEALGQDDEAEACAERMLALKNDCAAALYLKGKLAFKRRRVKDAEGYFLRAIEEDDAFGSAYSYLGLLKKKEGLHPSSHKQRSLGQLPQRGEGPRNL